MKSTDDRASDEADRHAEMMQEQREIDGLTNVVPHIRMPRLRPYVPEAANHSDQLNEE